MINYSIVLSKFQISDWLIRKKRAIELIHNKMAGYHWHILRFPIFVKNAFKKMKKKFFSKKHSFFITFSNYFNVENCLIFWQKNLIIKEATKFLRNKTI